MKVLGIIAEYNPFHNGHLHHLNTAAKLTDSTHIVAVMSGNFTQRGEPAVFDKYIRAEMAVKGGVDLVLELPALFATGSSEYFAYGSVELLHSLGMVDNLVFGSETKELSELIKVAEALTQDSPELNRHIKMNMDKGLSFPTARENALKHIIPELDEDIFSPNNILGIEYLKAIKHLNSSIIPINIPRLNSDYNSRKLQGHLSSATSIRELMKKGDFSALSPYVPESTLRIIENALDRGITPTFEENLSQVALFKLRTMTKSHLASIHDVREGLENKLIYQAMKANNLNDLISGTKSKRYTRTRIQRIIIKMLLDIESKHMLRATELKNDYLRVLAFNSKGRELLREIKKSSGLPIITNMRNAHQDFIENSFNLQLDIKSGNVYSTIKNGDKTAMQDFIREPIYVKSEE